MRIIHVCQFLGVGGLEQVLYLTIKEQLKLGHHVEVIVYDHDRRWIEKYSKLGITVHTDYTKQDGFDTKLMDYLAEKVTKFDIVHTHDLNPAIYLSIIKLKSFATGKRLSFIHTTHGMEHIKENPKTKLYEALIGLMANKIITVSPKFKNYYQSQLLTQNNKVVLIDNGVDINENILKTNYNETLEELNLDSSKQIAIYVARVVPLKGQLELIEYYKKIDDELLLVGPSGNDDYYQKCQSALSSNIKMLGSRSDIDKLLDLSDYFISNSFHEGLPIAVLEAGSRKLPCILYDIPGHAQFNQDGTNVILYNDLNFEEQLKKLKQEKENLKESFFKLIMNKYSIQNMTTKIVDLYKEVTSDK